MLSVEDDESVHFSSASPLLQETSPDDRQSQTTGEALMTDIGNSEMGDTNVSFSESMSISNSPLLTIAHSSVDIIDIKKRKSQKQQMIYGIFIVIGISLAWTGSTQFAQIVQSSDNFNAAFFVMWFSTCFKSLCLLPLIYRRYKLQYLPPLNLRLKYRWLYWQTFIAVVCFYTLWICANYAYIRALNSISASQVTVLFSSASAWVYILSLVMLNSQRSRFSVLFHCIRALSVLCSIGGEVAIVWSKVHNSFALFGSFLAIGSALFAALYKVIFKRIFDIMDVWHVSLFLFYLGCVNIVFGWIIVIILSYVAAINSETLPSNATDYPWLFLCIQALSSFIFDFLINFGVMFTYPLFISLGTILGIPINLIIDCVFRGAQPGWIPFIGTLLICIGFIAIVLTDALSAHQHTRIHRSPQTEKQGSIKSVNSTEPSINS